MQGLAWGNRVGWGTDGMIIYCALQWLWFQSTSNPPAAQPSCIFCETPTAPPFLLSAHVDLHLWTFQGCGLLTSIPPWWHWRATAKRPRWEGPGWILICGTWSEVVSPHCQPPHLPHHQTALCVWQVPNPRFFTVFFVVCQVPTMSDFAGLSTAFPRYTQRRLAGVRGIICSWRALLNPQITLKSSGAVWTGRWDWVLIPYPILPPSLISHAISVDVNRLTTLARGCRLLTRSMPAVDSASYCSSTGEIQSVDEKSAFSWEECDSCGSDQLAMKSSTGSVVWCVCVSICHRIGMLTFWSCQPTDIKITKLVCIHWHFVQKSKECIFGKVLVLCGFFDEKRRSVHLRMNWKTNEQFVLFFSFCEHCIFRL